ncbi:MAG: hypothetical protein VX026_09470, partial [Myxococcota bacterium]|nr:hypothetical protein [Myxococcota bacterium]
VWEKVCAWLTIKTKVLARRMTIYSDKPVESISHSHLTFMSNVPLCFQDNTEETENDLTGRTKTMVRQ